MAAHVNRQDDDHPTPNGCRWCGVAEADHYHRWWPEVGWHAWVLPTAEQRKTRMLARRRRRAEDHLGDGLLCG